MKVASKPEGAGSLNPLQEAFAVHQSGDLEGAIARYRAFLREQPDHADARHLLGVALIQSENPSAAVPELSQAVNLRPDNPDFLNNLGLAQFYSDLLPEARDSFERALELNPGSADALSNLGMTRHKLDDLAGALGAFDKALAIDPDNWETHHNHAAALQSAGRLDAAAAAFSKAIELSDGNAESWASLGAVRIELGETAGAFDAFWQAVKIDPLMWRAHDGFRNFKWAADQKPEMYDTLIWAAETYPEHAVTHVQLARALVEDRAFARAEPVARKAVAVDGGYPDAHAVLGRALAGLERFDEAISAFEAATSLGAEWETYEAFGECLIRAGDPARAAAVLREAHTKHPRRSESLGYLTIAMTEAGEDAVDDLVDYDADVTARTIAVPEGYASLEDFNDQLHAELAARHEARPEPIGQTMRGGTQIPGNPFANPAGAVLALKNAVIDEIRKYAGGLKPDPDHPFRRFINQDVRFTGAWSTILYGAGYDASHIHNEGWISGVYYIKVPDLPEDVWAAGEGCIQFGRPPDAYASERNRTRRLIRPQPGTLVLFPSDVWHGVQPFTQEGLRHAIAFDAI